ncbi:MAG: lysophospholipid acyltransferase family protein [Pyrinomonadaceae bacterium]
MTKYPAQIVVDALRLTGYVISKIFWFIRYEGLENIPDRSAGSFLIASNHQTYVDPVWICLPMRRRLRFMAVGKAFDWPIVGRLIRYLGAFPVTNDPRGAAIALNEAIRSLRDDAVLTVFPEGGRAFADGKVQPFKNGALRIALRADVPILPVTISGGDRIWPQGQKYPRLFRRVRVKYHPIVKVVEDGSLTRRENLDLWTEKLGKVIAEAS